MTFTRILPALFLGVALAGCGVTASQNTQINGVLTQLGNTLTSDLASQAAVANAATPPDVDGAQCAVAGQTVAAAIQKVVAATAPAAAGAPPVAPGALTVAEIATLYQPGSAQFNWAVKTLETGCIAKVHDVNQAVNSTAGIVLALPTVLALAAAPAGL